MYNEHCSLLSLHTIDATPVQEILTCCHLLTLNRYKLTELDMCALIPPPLEATPPTLLVAAYIVLPNDEMYVLFCNYHHLDDTVA